jgi:hypothetical protein
MSETRSGTPVSIMKLILIPSVITLAVTILRLVGELNNWSDFWFNRSAGGGGSPIGISWLAPIFGIYFALKLSREGHGPSSASRGILFSLISVALVVIASIISFVLISDQPGHPASLVLIGVVTIVAILILRKPWPMLFKTLIAYGYAARIPVAILMFFAIYGNWGTHYDVPPSDTFPAMHWIMKWFVIGALPQLLVWIWLTVSSGMLFGSIAVLLLHRGKQPAEAAHA